MPASADYLTKYLTASNGASSTGDFEDSSRPKKRRKKDKHANGTSTSTLLIADDDDGLLLTNQKKRTLEDDEDNPLVYNTNQRSAEFRKKKSSAWQQVDDEDVPRPANDSTQAVTNDANDDDAEADAILTAAAAESATRRAEIDLEDQPAVVDTDTGPRMSSGAKAGLQTVQDTAALLAREAAVEEAEQAARSSSSRKKHSSKPQHDSPAEETIYRDATGRRIDVSLKRAELRAAEQAKLVAEKRAREAAMGDVQIQQKKQAKEDLENAKFLTLGRSADDEELNEAQKEELRWEDPMAAYMAERAREVEREEEVERSKGGKGERRGGKDVELVKRVRKKEYVGAAPPNRYGIKPGWRWDGVDRGNGFEKEWFQARGKKTRNENLEYQWATDE